MRTVRSSTIFRIAAFFFGIILSTIVQAQICTGSLGDAVVNVTFGNGAGTGSPLPGATTFYNFIYSDCPNDGSYTVINSTNACFGNSWHSLPQDHTPGDNDGRMMLVNASIDSGDFYLDTVRGLCASTTYEFSAWVVNVLLTSACNGNGIDPNLKFNIESPNGAVLGTYSTGNIPETGSPEWKQYGLFFTTPINTNDVVIRITNNAPGGCGNDLALDDITFKPCGPVVTASIINNNTTDIDFCVGEAKTETLAATLGSGYTAPAQQWQESMDNGGTWRDIPGATATTYIFNKTFPGIYQYRLTVAEGTNILFSNCRVASNIVSINIHSLPYAGIIYDNAPLCEKAILKLMGDGGVAYYWTSPSGVTSNEKIFSLPASLNDNDGVFKLQVTDQWGCMNNVITAPITVYGSPIISVSGNQSICEGDGTTLSVNGGDEYLWSPSDGLSSTNTANPTAMPLQTTVYTVKVTKWPTGCSDTISVKVTVWKKPRVSAGEDKVIIKGESVLLNGNADASGISYSWTPVDYLNDPSLMQPVTNVPHDITYTLRVVSNAGCGTAEDNVFVKVFNDIYIPTAFSPNKDGNNDTWRIEALVAFPKAVVAVFNRYGDKIFEGSGSNSFWDGTFKGEQQPPGTYIYMIDFKGQRPVKKGWLMIVR